LYQVLESTSIGFFSHKYKYKYKYK